MIKFPVTEAKANALIERMERCGLKESDISEKFIRSSGPGGQKVNKTATCVYIMHNPTGFEIKCDKARSQRLYRYNARKFFSEYIERNTAGLKSKQQEKEDKLRKQKLRRRRRLKKPNQTED